MRHLLKRAYSSVENGLRAEQLRARYDSIKEKILSNTILTRDHLTPEISLHLITKDCKLFNMPISEEQDKVFDGDPFWAFYWPGGQALSRYLLDSPSTVKNRNVLDVGSGSGACAIAAKLCGSKSAIANDIDFVAAIAAKLNAKVNNVNITTYSENLFGSRCQNVDVVLVGDLFYDEEISGTVIPWLSCLRKSGKDVFVGDPGRHGLTTDALKLFRKIKTYKLPENVCIENNGFKYVNIWYMK